MGRKPSSLKLKLQSETLRVLSSRNLERIAGGTIVIPVPSAADTHCNGCEPDSVDGVETPTLRRTCSCGC
jgi:hypothetical protein